MELFEELCIFVLAVIFFFLTICLFFKWDDICKFLYKKIKDIKFKNGE